VISGDVLTAVVGTAIAGCSVVMVEVWILDIAANVLSVVTERDVVPAVAETAIADASVVMFEV
jgi:hypothetical protein